MTAGIGLLAMASGRLSLGSPPDPAVAVAKSPRVEVLARNLNNPRGLAVTPWGTVLVAEAGQGGNGSCLPSPENPDGQVCLGASGSVTVIGPAGQHRIITGLASIAAKTGRNAIGPSDVAFAAPNTVVVSFGVVSETNRRKELGAVGARLGTVRRFSLSEGSKRVADLSALEDRENPDGGRRDSNPNSVLALDDRRVAVIDSGSDRLLAVGAEGDVTQLAAFPRQIIARPPGSTGATHPQTQARQGQAGQPQVGQGQAGQVTPGQGQTGQGQTGQGQAGQTTQGQARPGRFQPEGARPGHLPSGQMALESVPTSVTRGPDGAFYVGELSGFPFPAGAARVWRVVPGEMPTVYAKGFTNIIDLAFDKQGRLYVLEIAKNGLQSTDKTGALIRVEPDGKHTELLSKQLTMPGGMAFGPGGSLYISNRTTSAGTGEVLRVQL